MTDDTNIFKVIQGGGKTDDTKTEVYDYEIEDLDGNVFNALGFLIFTTQHVAIMRDEGSGPIPVLIVPLGLVKAASLVDEELDEAPF